MLIQVVHTVATEGSKLLPRIAQALADVAEELPENVVLLMVLPGKGTSTFSLWDVHSVDFLRDVVEDLLGDWCTNEFHEISDEGLYYAIDGESSLLDSIDDTIDNTITTITEHVKNLNSSASNVLRQATSTISNTAHEPSVQEAMATGISAVKDTWTMFRSFTNATLQAMAPPPDELDQPAVPQPAGDLGLQIEGGALTQEPPLEEQIVQEQCRPAEEEEPRLAEDIRMPSQESPIEDEMPGGDAADSEANLEAVESPAPVEANPTSAPMPETTDVNDGETNSSGSSYVEVPSKSSSVAAAEKDDGVDEEDDDDEWINT